MHAGKKAKSEEVAEEKTGFEKFEAEVKETIFGVISLLVNEENGEESMAYALFDGVTECFQLIGFPFLSVIIFS